MSDAHSPESHPTEQIISSALADQAQLLLFTGRRAEAIVVAQALLARITDETDPGQLRLLARGSATLAAAHVADARYYQAIAILDVLVSRFEHAADPTLREQVALALANKVIALDALGLEGDSLLTQRRMLSDFPEEALTILDESTGPFAAAGDSQVREHLASALYAKARILTDLDRPAEAILALKELIARFQDDQDSNIKLIVIDAREDLTQHEPPRQ